MVFQNFGPIMCINQDPAVDNILVLDFAWIVTQKLIYKQNKYKNLQRNNIPNFFCEFIAIMK